MAVSVNMPHQKQREPEEKDPLDRVLKALGIASTVFGIKDAFTKSELLKAETGLKQQELQTKIGLSDPKSPQSMDARKNYGQFGITVPENVSASGAEKNYGPLHNYVQKKVEFDTYKQPELERQKNELDYKKSQDVASREIEIRKEISGQDVTKHASALNGTYATMKELAKNPSPANDTSIVYNYIKSLDSATGVKDAEVALAKSMGGTVEQISAMYKSMVEGTAVLTPSQREDIMDATRRMHNSAINRYNTVVDQYNSNYPELSKNRISVFHGQPEYTKKEVEQIAKFKAALDMKKNQKQLGVTGVRK